MAIWNSFFGNMAMGNNKGGGQGQGGDQQSWWKQQDQWQQQQDQQPTIGRDIVHDFITNTVNPAMEQNSLSSLMSGGYQPQGYGMNQPRQQQGYGMGYGMGYGGRDGGRSQGSLYSLMGRNGGY